MVEEYLNRSSGEYLVGDKLTVADIAVVVWFVVAQMVGVDFDLLPKSFAWAKKIVANPFVKKGFSISQRLGVDVPHFDV